MDWYGIESHLNRTFCCQLSTILYVTKHKKKYSSQSGIQSAVAVSVVVVIDNLIW